MTRHMMLRAALIGLACTMAAAPTWAASRGVDRAAQQAMSPTSAGANEQFCEEELKLADQWVQWAVHKRSECIDNHEATEDRSACMQRLRDSLDDLERDYAQAYTSQISNLRPNHPIVVTILRRLKSHKELANAILGDAPIEPNVLATHLKQQCLVSASSSAANIGRR